MIRVAALCLLCLTTPAVAQTVAERAAEASTQLQEAVAGLEAAQSSRDRVSALTQTIRAYENGLAALREALRQAHLREATLQLQFQAKRDRVAQLVGVLSQLESRPGPLLLLHPSGPLGTVRSGMMLADVTPALQAEAETLGAELAELRDLRASEALPLAADFPYAQVPGLSNEMVERLSRAAPVSLAAAGRVPGITPAALSALLVHARRREQAA